MSDVFELREAGWIKKTSQDTGPTTLAEIRNEAQSIFEGGASSTGSKPHRVQFVLDASTVHSQEPAHGFCAPTQVHVVGDSPQAPRFRRWDDAEEAARALWLLCGRWGSSIQVQEVSKKTGIEWLQCRTLMTCGSSQTESSERIMWYGGCIVFLGNGRKNQSRAMFLEHVDDYMALWKPVHRSAGCLDTVWMRLFW